MHKEKTTIFTIMISFHSKTSPSKPRKEASFCKTVTSQTMVCNLVSKAAVATIKCAVTGVDGVVTLAIKDHPVVFIIRALT